MNASLGIVLRKGDRERLLSLLAPRLRTWGGEVVEEEGEPRYSVAGLANVEFTLFAVTPFIRRNLPDSDAMHEMEYAAVDGSALLSYASWAEANRDAADLHEVETGLLELLGRASFWALLFAPDHDRLEARIEADAGTAIRALRRGAGAVWASEGFLAIGPS